MAKKLDHAIGLVLKKYDFGPDAAWDCHGTWVVYHRVLEQVAAKAGIVYGPPTVLRSERDEAVIIVTGSLDNKTEWSIGEAVIGQNYLVKGKQAAYPYAMAEKRAKDRVILKLIGLHGLAYSEEEADDFKASTPAVAPQAEDGNPFAPDEAEIERDHLIRLVDGCTTLDQLATLWKSARVQEFIRTADPNISGDVTISKDTRKAIIQGKKEAA